MTFSDIVNWLGLGAPKGGDEPDGRRASDEGKSFGGFFATLTPEQEREVMAYRGPETIGDPADVDRMERELREGIVKPRR